MALPLPLLLSLVMREEALSRTNHYKERLGKSFCRRLTNANRVGYAIERIVEAIATTHLRVPSRSMQFGHRNLLKFLLGLIKHMEETINLCMIRTMYMWLDFYSMKSI